MPKIHRLSCLAQNYAWGKLGSTSKVAQLCGNASDSKQAISEAQPYAELWMGTHPNAPSTLFQQKVTLLEAIKSDPVGLLSQDIATRFVNDLPFLFKVLSVGKALSIQAHPDIELAKSLHRQFPNMYKDANHKPEMALALTPFEALCGFRGLEEIAINLQQFPEFAAVIGVAIATEFVEYVREYPLRRRASLPPTTPLIDNNDQDDKSVLKKLFGVLMHAEVALVTLELRKLVARLKDSGVAYSLGSAEELVLRLYGQYPDDVGCFCVLIMNYILLQPGDAIFLAANEPHAYLSGDCIECMATSDNVVRAGLTPKAKDVDVLVNMLTYESYGPGDILMKPTKTKQSHTTLFRAPVPEFSVLRTVLTVGQSDEFDSIRGPSIIVVVEGEGGLSGEGHDHALIQGSVFFIGADTSISISSKSGSLVFYRAFADLEGFKK